MKKQASYISELDGDDNAGSKVATEAEPVINDQRIAHDDDGASQLALKFERYHKTRGSEQMKKVSDIYEERLSQAADTLQGFLDFQDTQLTPRLYVHKRKISEVTEEQINTQKKLKSAFDRHQMSVVTLLDMFDKNTTTIQKRLRTFDKNLSDLKVRQKAETAELLSKVQKDVASFKKHVTKLSKENRDFASMNQSMMSLLTF
ncbi:hypothetical protein SpCBS45565_g05583 [Spizellomyces sp. 'palustris']|nr:hypothetical protein SpCBS45565_g05583 [Spizellomyces sp. 'palustris']